MAIELELRDLLVAKGVDARLGSAFDASEGTFRGVVLYPDRFPEEGSGRIYRVQLLAVVATPDDGDADAHMTLHDLVRDTLVAGSDTLLVSRPTQDQRYPEPTGDGYLVSVLQWSIGDD